MIDGYKLKLLSKKLRSGKCQIKFSIFSNSHEFLYGYMLAESGTTLREVVKKIECQVTSLENRDLHYHKHLYNLTGPKEKKEPILIFNN